MCHNDRPFELKTADLAGRTARPTLLLRRALGKPIAARPRSKPATASGNQSEKRDFSTRFDDDLDSSVLCPTLCGVVRGDRMLLTESHGLEPFGFDAFLHERPAHGFGSTAAEHEVGVAVAGRIGMALDAHELAWVLADELDDLVQVGAGLRFQLRRAGGEDVLSQRHDQTARLFPRHEALQLLAERFGGGLRQLGLPPCRLAPRAA